MIGIIGAMQLEIEPFLKEMTTVDIKHHAGITFNYGHINGIEIVIVKSGVGKVNAALTTQALIDLYNCDLIINTGIAGTLSKQNPLGSCYIASEVSQHDFSIPLINESYEMYLYAKKAHLSLASKLGIKSVAITTGDQFITSQTEVKKIINNTNATVCDMESASIAYVAKQNNCDWLVIRAISDSCCEEEYERYEKKAAILAANKVIALIDLLVRK